MLSMVIYLKDDVMMVELFHNTFAEGLQISHRVTESLVYEDTKILLYQLSVSHVYFLHLQPL